MRSSNRQEIDLGRRRFLIAGTSVAGGVVLGFPALNVARAAIEEGTMGGERQIGYFIEIRPDGDEAFEIALRHGARRARCRIADRGVLPEFEILPG